LAVIESKCSFCGNGQISATSSPFEDALRQKPLDESSATSVRVGALTDSFAKRFRWILSLGIWHELSSVWTRSHACDDMVPMTRVHARITRNPPGKRTSPPRNPGHLVHDT
jgi:hypothetical protein